MMSRAPESELSAEQLAVMQLMLDAAISTRRGIMCSHREPAYADITLRGPLPQSEQAHYAYLRGMTDHRIGYKAEARHWLAIARAFDEQSPGILPTDWKQRTTETLAELDGVVQTQGYAALKAPAK